MKLEAYSDRVIVRKVNIEVKSAGGLFLSAGEVDENRDVVFGRVLFVGPGKQVDGSGRIPMMTEVGDLVAFPDRQPLRQHYEGEYIFILRESDILYRNLDTNIVEADYQEISEIKKSTKFLG